MLWHIELKFCTWLCSNVLQIKFECRQFVSIFVGVMPLLELKILQIHSFPHFSLTCFDILSWNFAYDFVLLYYRSSSSVVNFCGSYAPFGTQNTENIQFSALFSDMLWLIELIRPSSDGTYYGMVMSVRPSAHFLHFSHTCFDIMSWNFAHDFVLMYYRSSLSVVTLRQFLYARRDVLWYGDVRPSVRVSVRPFSALFSYMLWHIELKFCTWICSNVL